MRMFLLVLAAGLSFAASAQTEKSKYNYQDLFSPLFYPFGVNEYRSATGEPGPKYWQNKASYQISASLDDVKDAITASVTITYTNNSPHTMDFLWLPTYYNHWNHLIMYRQKDRPFLPFHPQDDPRN